MNSHDATDDDINEPHLTRQYTTIIDVDDDNSSANTELCTPVLRRENAFLQVRTIHQPSHWDGSGISALPPLAAIPSTESDESPASPPQPTATATTEWRTPSAKKPRTEGNLHERGPDVPYQQQLTPSIGTDTNNSSLPITEFDGDINYFDEGDSAGGEDYVRSHINTVVAAATNPAIPALPRQQRRLRRRDWVITHWLQPNPKPLLEANQDMIRYAVWQKERCPTTGRDHWQMYIEFNASVDRTTVRNILMADSTQDNNNNNPLSEPWLQIRRNTRTAARQYCMKTETRIMQDPANVGPFELGCFTQQGQRSDLMTVQNDLENGRSLAEITADHFGTMIRYGHGVRNARALYLQSQGMAIREMDVWVVFGPTGTGKTTLAVEIARNANIKAGDSDTEVPFFLDHSCAGGSGQLWFDGYDGQRTLIIDDYNSWIPITYMLRLLDKYPMRLPVKGSYTFGLYTTVVITSNVPTEQWKDADGSPINAAHRAALNRRIHHIVRMDGAVGEQTILK